MKLLIFLLLGFSFFILGLEAILFTWAIFDFFNQKYDHTTIPASKNKFIGIYIFLMFFPFIMIVGTAGEYFLGEFEKQNSVNQLQNRITELGFNFLFSVLVFSPIVEEFYFRKLLFNEIYLHYGAFFSVLVTAMLFSAVHFNIYAFPVLFVLGLSLGVVKIFSANVFNSILCHSFFNLFMLFQIIYKV